MKSVLIVSHNALSLHANNGKTLNSLFASYPSENICQLYFQEEVPESDKFNKYYRITDLDVLLAIFFRWRRADVGREMKAENRVVSHYRDSGKAKMMIVRLLRKLDRIKLIARDMIYSSGYWKSNSLRYWLECCKPDSIFFVGAGSVFSFKIAMWIADELSIPIDFYITDDYIVNASEASILNKIILYRLRREYVKSFERARNYFVIGEQMALAFANLYDRQYLPIMNSVVVRDEMPKIANLDSKSPISIVYTGGLRLGRDVAIYQFSELLKSICAKYGYAFDFRVYSAHKPSEKYLKKYKENNVLYCAAVDAGQLSGILSSSHYVLHVESFYERYTRQTKLSVSTKIPEYLISGSCVIAFSPSDLASYKIINDNNIGICIDSKSPSTCIIENFVNSIKSNDLRAKYIYNGYNYAKEKFSIEKNQNYLYNLIND